VLREAELGQAQIKGALAVSLKLVRAVGDAKPLVSAFVDTHETRYRVRQS
jgi:hypothetical protein